MVRQVLCHAYGQPNLLTTHTKASDCTGAFLFCQHRMRVAGVVGVVGVIGVLGVVGVVGGRRRTPNHFAIDVKSSGYPGAFFCSASIGCGRHE